MGQPEHRRSEVDEYSVDGVDDVVLPCQFFSSGADPRGEPEKRLMVAVLEEAIAASMAGVGSEHSEQLAVAAEADRWFASDDHAAPFAFRPICDILGLEADRVRELLASWQARRLAFRRPRVQAGRGRHQVRSPGRRPRRAA